MDYMSADRIGRTGLGELASRMMMRDDVSFSSALSKSASLKGQAAMKRFAGKFDPLNIVKILTFGSPLMTTLAGRMLKRSNRDVSYFTGINSRASLNQTLDEASGVRKPTRDGVYHTRVGAGRVVALKAGDGLADIMSKMYNLNRAMYEYMVKQGEIDSQFAEERDMEMKRFLASLKNKTGDKSKPEQEKEKEKSFLDEILDKIPFVLANPKLRSPDTTPGKTRESQSGAATGRANALKDKMVQPRTKGGRFAPGAKVNVSKLFPMGEVAGAGKPSIGGGLLGWASLGLMLWPLVKDWYNKGADMKAAEEAWNELQKNNPYTMENMKKSGPFVFPGSPQMEMGNVSMGEGSPEAKALRFFMSKEGLGLTQAQAAGLIGNLKYEAGGTLNTGAVGDSGKAYGIAQWQPERQQKFKEVMKKDIRDSSLEEQLQFVAWEYKNKPEYGLERLKQQKTDKAATIAVMEDFERPSAQARVTSLNDRMLQASKINKMELTDQQGKKTSSFMDLMNTKIVPEKKTNALGARLNESMAKNLKENYSQGSPNVIIAPQTNNVVNNSASRGDGGRTPNVDVRHDQPSILESAYGNLRPALIK